MRETLADQSQLFFRFLTFQELMVNPRVVQCEPNVSAYSAEKFHIARVQRPRTIEQLQDSSKNTLTIEDRHAQCVVGSVPKSLVELGREPGIVICVSRIEYVAGGGDGTCQALTYRQTDLEVIDSLSDE